MRIGPALPEPWMEWAKCGGQDTDLWLTENLPAHPHRRIKARMLCRGCPKIGDCADWAIRTEATSYVYAGVPLTTSTDGNERNYAQLYSIARKFQEKTK